MKILFVFNHPAPYKINLLQELSKFYQIDVIFERNHNADRPEAFYYLNPKQLNVLPLKGINFKNENHFSFALKNYLKLHHHEYDLIIMNGYSTISEMLALNYLIKKHIPYALYINGAIIKKDNLIKHHYKSKYIKHACNYFSPGKSANDFLLHYGANANKIYNYIYSTVFSKDILNEPLTKEEKDKLKVQNGLDLNAINFVSTGQFIARKNNFALIKIFETLPQNYHLTLIGEGKEKQKYQRFIAKHKLKNRIKLLPFIPQPELLKLLRCFDFFISLSREDIYGHMINEALSQGLPVISSNRVMSARQLINENNGIIIDITHLKDIEEIIKNIQLKSVIACLQTAKENTIEKMIESHKAIFEDLKK